MPVHQLCQLAGCKGFADWFDITYHGESHTWKPQKGVKIASLNLNACASIRSIDRL